MKFLQLETIIFYIQKRHQPVNKSIPLPLIIRNQFPAIFAIISPQLQVFSYKKLSLFLNGIKLSEQMPKTSLISKTERSFYFFPNCKQKLEIRR